MNKIIETALPLQELSASAIGESVRKGHIGGMHLWWNRSPIVSSAAILYASMIDADERAQNLVEKYDILRKLEEGSSEGINQASASLCGADTPTICDSFSGFGGLALASQRLGLHTEASDLNSVAALLTKAAGGILPRFQNHIAVHQDADLTRHGAAALADDINYYGRQMLKTVMSLTIDAYPNVGGVQPTAWIWVRTVECPNPACKCRMPLSTSYVLTKSKGNERWAEPVLENDRIRYRIHDGICPEDKETNKVGTIGAKFQCPICGSVATDTYIREQGKQHRLGMQMIAVVSVHDGKKCYSEPSEEQEMAANLSLPEDLPTGTIAENSRWFSPPLYGLTEYSDLYTARQLSMLTAFCDQIPEIIKNVSADAVRAGMEKDETPLNNSGKGALAYGQAVATYLAIAISRMANYHSTVCTWDNRKGVGRAAFTRQAIPMTWTFVEENPFANVTGNWLSMVDAVAVSVFQLSSNAEIHVTQADAVTRDYPSNAILFAELPYYDNVGYADLSDYFYIWLRRCLRDVYPDLFTKVVSSKEELSSIPEHYDGDKELANYTYREAIYHLLENFYPAASNDYPSVLFFEYGKQDDHAIASGTGDTLAPFEQLVDAIIKAGFVVTAIWPIRTEKDNPRFSSFRIAVVFRKQMNDCADATTRRGFINVLKRELGNKLDIAYSKGIDDTDKTLAGLGMGMQIFSHYKRVMNADGSDICVHDVLQIIYQEVTDYIDAHNTETQAEEA